MGWGKLPILIFFFLTLVSADLCPEPVIPNGEVTGQKEDNLFFGEISCNVGYTLVGASKTIKCRHGVWSQKELPVCSAIGGCPTLPNLKNGRNVPIQRSRGSAYRFKCNRGFKRFGELRTHCIGQNWSHGHMPSCAKATCDETGMLDIPYGEGRSLLRGAVYKYRCNTGVEMEGSNTLVCDGDSWNGTVPHCNVEPTEPELELTVSGVVVDRVKPGDWVLVTCQARGGHPVADIGLTLDGVPAGSKDFRNFRNSFTFTATQEDNGKTILCTAVNKVGTSAVSTTLHVLAAPTQAAISGPKTVHHQEEFTYECSVEGGNPEPEISWTVSDHLGQVMEMKGQKMGPGLSRMLLKTGSKERMLTVNCKGENEEGIVSNTMHVHTHYLPKSIQITGPTSALPGDYAHFTCLTTETFPVPDLKWKIEKSGELYVVDEIDADVSSDALEDGGVVAYAKTDILMEDGFKNAMIQCVAIVDGQEMVMSEKHKIDVIAIEESIVENEIQNEEVVNENEDTSEEPFVEDEIKEEEVVQDDAPSFHYMEEEDDDDTSDETEKILVKLVKLEKKPENEEEEKSKNIWVPLNPVNEIEDYQNLGEMEQDDTEDDTELDDSFLRPSALPEAPMLKQEKEQKSQSVETSVPVSLMYSSSPTIFYSPILLAMALFLSTLFH